MNNWLLISAIAGAIVSVSAVLILFWKIVTFLGKMSRIHPVIMAIAEQFRTNSGSSLKDQVDRLELMVNTGIAAAELASAAADKASQAAARESIILDGLRSEMIRFGALGERVSRLEERELKK